MPFTSPDNGKTPRTVDFYERYMVMLILALTAVTYMGAVKFDFVYDDYPQIVSNPFVKSWQYVPQYFSSSVWKQMFPLSPGNYYRPLFVLWIRVNYSLFGQNPFGWHAATIGLHLAMTWLVFVLVKRLTGRFTVAWLTTLVFGLHPVHHEVVDWISGSTESLFSIFFVMAFLAYLRSERNRKAVWTAISCVLYALAMLCKETAIVLPMLVFAHRWISLSGAEESESPGLRQRFKQSNMQIAFYAPVAIVYRYARYRILSGFGHFLSNPSVSTWVLTLPSVLLFYIKNWLFPVRLSEYYDLYYQLHPSLLHVILPVSIVVAIASLIWMFRKQLGTLEAGYAAIWIMIPLLPALSFVVFYPDQLVHDRYFYLPSVGSSLLSALFIDRVTKSRRVVFGQSLATVGTAMVLTIVLATITFRTASYWMDGYTLFSRAHEVAPANLSAAKNLIVEFIERREYDKAQLLLESEYRKNSDDFGFALNLGRLQYFQKQYAKAEEYTRKSIALSPTMAEPYAYLGIIQLKENRPREAQASLNKAVELNPWDAHFRTSYGIVLAANGDCTGAMTQFNAALSLSPDDAITKREIFNCNAAKSPKPASPSQLIQR